MILAYFPLMISGFRLARGLNDDLAGVKNDVYVEQSAKAQLLTVFVGYEKRGLKPTFLPKAIL
jgi:hypothetical protein